MFSFIILRRARGPGASAGASALPRYSPQSVILRLWGVISGWILWGWADTRWLCSRLFVALPALSRLFSGWNFTGRVFEGCSGRREIFVRYGTQKIFPISSPKRYPLSVHALESAWQKHRCPQDRTSQTINLMLSTIHLVIKSAKQKVAGSCTSAATKISVHLLLYFHSKNSHQEISECIHLFVFFSPS